MNEQLRKSHTFARADCTPAIRTEAKWEISVRSAGRSTERRKCLRPCGVAFWCRSRHKKHDLPHLWHRQGSRADPGEMLSAREAERLRLINQGLYYG
jgi:hypothetical protein